MATDFLAFSEGSQYLLTNGDGLPATCYFFLSTSSCNGAGGSTQFAIGNTLGGAALGEITGTGYARQSQAAPTPSGLTITFVLMSWSTGVNTNWPNNVRSVVLATTVANTGKAICAWNLIAGGAARDLSQASTVEQFTPTLTTSS